MPPPDRNLLSHFSSSLSASFSTSFSRDGSKYAVASQEGVVCVWDVRSTRPLKVYQTDKSESWNSSGNGLASGYLSDDPYEWTRGLSKAPGWSARNVKFGNGGVDGCGKEIMTFTEVCYSRYTFSGFFSFVFLLAHFQIACDRCPNI